MTFDRLQFESSNHSAVCGRVSVNFGIVGSIKWRERLSPPVSNRNSASGVGWSSRLSFPVSEEFAKRLNAGNAHRLSSTACGTIAARSVFGLLRAKERARDCRIDALRQIPKTIRDREAIRRRVVRSAVRLHGSERRRLNDIEHSAMRVEFSSRWISLFQHESYCIRSQVTHSIATRSVSRSYAPL